jgi:hypothetical protein
MLHARGKHEVVVVFAAVAAMLLGPAVGSASAAADSRVRVLQETPVSPAADIPPNVRKECNGLGEELPRAIMRANPRVTIVRTPQELQDKTGRYLFVEITEVKAHNAGAFTGKKRMNVRGSLVDNGRTIADFQADRGTMAAAGTCSTLQKTEKELGDDIGQWLLHPTPNARLGDK